MVITLMSCTSQDREQKIKKEIIDFIYRQQGFDRPRKGISWTIKERKEFISKKFSLIKAFRYRDLTITVAPWGGGTTGYWHVYLYFHGRKENDDILYYSLEDNIDCRAVDNIPCSDSLFSSRVEELISTNSFVRDLNKFLQKTTKGLTGYERKHIIDFIFEICLNMKKVVPNDINWLMNKMGKLELLDLSCPCCSSSIEKNSAQLFFMSLSENCSIYKAHKTNSYLQVLVNQSGKFPIQKVQLLNPQCTYTIML